MNEATRPSTRATQRSASAQHGGLDACEITLSGGEEFFAFAAALGGQIGIAADHQALVEEGREHQGRRLQLAQCCRYLGSWWVPGFARAGGDNGSLASVAH